MNFVGSTGRYNGITRDCEKHLFPALRRVGMRFYASTQATRACLCMHNMYVT